MLFNKTVFSDSGVSKRKDLMKIPKAIFHIKSILSHIIKMYKIKKGITLIPFFTCMIMRVYNFLTKLEAFLFFKFPKNIHSLLTYQQNILPETFRLDNQQSKC